VALTLGSGKTGGSLSGLNPPRVAVFAATSGATDLATKLTATGAFNSVGSNTLTSTPTVAQLQAYDAVVVYTYLTVTAAFGDNLATYLESGGGVVLMDYESQETGTYALLGRYEAQYTMSTPISSASWLTTVVTLGTLLEPASPLLSGVATYGLKGSTPYHLPASAFNRNSPIVVAQYSDGAPAVVRGIIGGHPVVEINSSGSSSTYSSSYGWDATSDGAKLIRNALLYVIPPATFTGPTSLDLGTQPLYTPSAASVITYTNVSSSPQTLTAFALSGSHIGDFSVSPSSGLPATVMPGNTFAVNVVFTPSGTGLRAATLSATITGAAGPLTTLLRGTGL
jgi:hypothetical protein